jgi:pSer/pThr/pTyr-binding forkhead associated (FHA) protein
MSFQLIVNPGTPHAWEIPLKPGVNRIGRGEQNDFTINHGSVSTHHCEITITDSGVILKDLGSTNGSFVERVRVTEIQINPGQHLQFGSVDMVFESTASTANIASSATVVEAQSPQLAQPVPASGGLRINRAATEAPSSPTTKPVPGFQPNVRTAPASGFRPAVEDSGEDQKPSFGLSLTGVFLGALIGAIVWHLIYRFTGKNYGVMALVTGVLAGVAPQLMGHYKGKLMGFLAATVALVAILTTQYFNTVHEVENDKKEAKEYEQSWYDEELAYAKRAVQAVPEGTEKEVRAFLAKEDSSEEYKIQPEEIDPEEVRDFQNTLPKYRDLAGGKITPEDLAKMESDPEVEKIVGRIDRIFFIISVLGVFNIVNIFLGVGAAFLTAQSGRD